MNGYLYAHVHCCIIYNRCPSVDEEINKMWTPHSEIVFSLNKEEILTHALTWMNLEDIILSKVSQS